MDIGQYAAFLAQTFFDISPDLTAAFASGNPTTSVSPFSSSRRRRRQIITDTIALLKALLEQTIVLITVLVPLLTASLAPLAAGVVLTPDRRQGPGDVGSRSAAAGGACGETAPIWRAAAVVHKLVFGPGSAFAGVAGAAWKLSPSCLRC